MFEKEWQVLLVDDDPDVLSVSQLAMKNFKVYGLPLKIFACQSKAEAIELLEKKSDLLPSLAVAFVDVVMETDQAGLELCQYLREQRRNVLIQLYIRTGQPGVAPERAVVDRYEINGYFTKVEATEDKLYSLTQSGVRQFYWSAYSLGGFMFIRSLLSVMPSREKLVAVMNRFIAQSVSERGGEQVASFTNVNLSYVFDNQVVAGVGWDAPTALAEYERLNKMPGPALGITGDRYVWDDQNHLLVKVAPTANSAEGYLVATPSFRLPGFSIQTFYDVLKCLASMWHSSK